MESYSVDPSELADKREFTFFGCVDTGCCLKDLTEARDDRDGWRERESQGNPYSKHALMMIMMIYISVVTRKGVTAFWAQPEELCSQVYRFRINKHSLRASHLFLTLVGFNVGIRTLIHYFESLFSCLKMLILINVTGSIHSNLTIGKKNCIT